MKGISFDVYSLDGAYELAATATDAEIRSGFRDGQTSLERNHVDGLYGAVLGAGSATGAVYVDNTDVDVKDYTSRLGLMLLFNCEGFDGTCRTYLAAQVAVIVAIAFVKLHDRLHDATQTVLHTCWFKHVAGTLAHAKMT